MLRCILFLGRIDWINPEAHPSKVVSITAPEARGSHDSLRPTRLNCARLKRRRGGVGVGTSIFLALGFALALCAQNGPSAADTVGLEPVAPRALPVIRLDRLDPPAGSEASLALPVQGSSIVHFFATWCEPCREEMPALSSFAAAEGVRVILIDVAEPEARIRRFFETLPAPGEILLDRDRAAARAYGMTALPATLVLRDGVPHLRAQGPVDWADPKVRTQIRDMRSPAQPANSSMQH